MSGKHLTTPPGRPGSVPIRVNAQPRGNAASAAAASRPTTSQHLLRRRLLGALRDAHLSGVLRIEVLQRCCQALTNRPLRDLVWRMTEEAEEQQRRLDHAFASLREHPGGGDASEAAAAAARLHVLLTAWPQGEALDHALADLLWRATQRDEAEVTALRLTANAAGLHLVARLLDLTAAELRQAAATLTPLVQRPSGMAPH